MGDYGDESKEEKKQQETDTPAASGLSCGWFLDERSLGRLCNVTAHGALPHSHSSSSVFIEIAGKEGSRRREESKRGLDSGILPFRVSSMSAG